MPRRGFGGLVTDGQWEHLLASAVSRRFIDGVLGPDSETCPLVGADLVRRPGRHFLVPPVRPRRGRWRGLSFA